MPSAPLETSRPRESVMQTLNWKTRQARATGVYNAFCPTGKGGGVDPTCSPGKRGGTITAKERNAVVDYSTDKFQQINGELRRGNLSSDSARIVSGVDSFLDKSEKRAGATARSFNLDDSPQSNHIREMLVEGGVFTDKAYLSTAKQPSLTDMAVMKSKTPLDNRVTLRIEGSSGVDISQFSLNPGEGEVLYPRGTRFRVKKALHGSNGGIIAVLEELKEITNQLLTNTKPKTRKPNPLQADPSRTQALRRKWLTDINRRFRNISKAIKQLIVDEDVFGLRVDNVFCPTGPGGGVDPTCSPGGGRKGITSRTLSPAQLEIAERYKDGQVSHAEVREYLAASGIDPNAQEGIFDALYKHNLSSGPESDKRLLEMWNSDSEEGKGLREYSKWTEWQLDNGPKGEVEFDLESLKRSHENRTIEQWNAIKGNYQDGDLTNSPKEWIKLKEAQAKGEKVFYRKGPLDKAAISTTTSSGGARSGTSLFKPDRYFTTSDMRKKGYRLIGGNRAVIGATSAQEREHIWLKVSDTALNQFTTNQRWRFYTSDLQLQFFQQWLVQQFAKEILVSSPSNPTDDAYWQRYVEEGYRKGAGRAFEDLNRKHKVTGGKEKLDFYEGTKAQFLQSSFGRPESINKVKLLAGRTFSELEGVTQAMATQLGRVLTDGLVQGQNPITIARTLQDELGFGQRRAETIARTEIIRAHAEGALDSYEQMGVEEIGVMVEWDTAKDSRVCPLCAPLQGVVLKVAEAKGMFPRHPNCRCTPVPANLGEDPTEQIRGKVAVQGAIDRSILAERPKKKGVTLAQLKARSRWVGVDKKISKKRPESLA